MRRSGLTFVEMGIAALLSAAPLSAETIYVSATATGGQDNGTSWSNAHVDLQDALARAAAGDQVWVAAGTYVPRLPRNPDDPRTASFAVPTDVGLFGGFDGTEGALDERAGLFEQTILSGDRNGDDEPNGLRTDNVYSVVVLEQGGQENQINGFTIRGGQGTAQSVEGAGIKVLSGNLTLANAWISDNALVTNQGLGAGVALRNGRLTVRDSQIVGNRITGETSADWTGGAGIGVLDARVSIVRCRFANNLALGPGHSVGGGLAIRVVDEEVGVIRVSGSWFEDNASAHRGGGMYLEGSVGECLITGSRFDRNFSRSGGGLHVERASEVGAYLGLFDCSFRGNEVGRVDDSLPRIATGAGGLDVKNPERSISCVLLRTEFVDNTVHDPAAAQATGGGVDMEADFVYLNDCQVADNRLASDRIDRGAAGGAVLNGRRVVIESSAILRNRIHRPGAPNQLTGSGGGLSVGSQANESPQRLTMRSVLLAGNLARQSAGGVLEANLIQASNLTVAGNRASEEDGGLTLSLREGNRVPEAVMDNSILWGNLVGSPETAVAENQLAGSRLGVRLLRCNIQNLTGAYGQVVDLIETDPLFADPIGPDGLPATGDEDLRLRYNSPCVDAGDNGLTPPDNLDQDNDGDREEPLPRDLDGNPRRVDQRLQVDEGFGRSPIVDLGAYEFQVECPGDLNGDAVVDLSDVIRLLNGFGSSEESEAFEPTADIQPDGRIDLNDLAAVLDLFGADCQYAGEEPRIRP